MTTEDIDDNDAGLPDKARMPEPDKKVPGKLRGHLEAFFHTGEAVSLVKGRSGRDGKAHITGLTGFAKHTQIVMDGSGNGDPFADFALIQIEAKLEEIDKQMRARGKELQALVEQRLDAGITPDSGLAFEARTWSTDPVEEEFILGHYGSMALLRLKQFDELVLRAKGLLHHHVINNDECRKFIEEAGNSIRGLLSFANAYRFCACTRDDLLNRTLTGVRAIEKLRKSGFINKHMFGDDDDVCDYFSSYSTKPMFLAESAEDVSSENAPTAE